MTGDRGYVQRSTMAICPVCNRNEIKNVYSRQCRECYLKSPGFQERLRKQSRSANLKANQVRWAHKKNHWQFSDSSPELAYIVGAYLTDGYISRMSTSDRRISGFEIAGTYPEFVDSVKQCMIEIRLSPTDRKPKNRTHEGRKTQYRVASTSQSFGLWLDEQCNGKKRIPQFILEAPITHKIAFLAGAIDGDGCVDEWGSITIYGTQIWMKELPILLSSVGIKTAGYRTVKVLTSGKMFARISINRTDFLRLGGFSTIPFKQSRLICPKRRQKTHYPCVVCGEFKSSQKDRQCRDCWKNSDALKSHMTQASKKGREKRWGNRS